MTIGRLEIAAMALQGMLSNNEPSKNFSANLQDKTFVAQTALEYADALIAQMNEPTNKRVSTGHIRTFG